MPTFNIKRNNNFFSNLQKKIKRLSIIFKILLSLGILVGSFFILRSDLFSIKNFDCKTQYGPCLEEDTEPLKVFLGENLFSVSVQEVEETSMQNFMNRKSTVQRVFPNTLAIVLDKRKPLVALKPQNIDSQILVDREGVIVEFTQNSPLPIIIVERVLKDLVVGKKLDDEIVVAIQSFYFTYKTNNVMQGNITQDSLVFTLDNLINVNYSLKQDPKVSVGALQLIMSRSRIDGKLPKIIDLRYSKPVIRYE